ncbi:MinD-like ATPase involved in chromosome partitioning or flagellar assembly [Agrococcus baldri]|uniref:MinD-like ATPase involved in chromosome partitioning or flagellar assembly n=1 Tax=Agrococcus baldri TaxID=153730 RepID=A0AA94HN38_9MICO|nr:regulator [Agrococcus baldri]SFS14399.1 MinD-like ATPase involved in chromosome partitioning or flagellar assembly [Agrococcus baldri]
MIGIAVSAPLEREDAVVREAARHGHRVAIRAATAADLLERLAARADDAEPSIDLVLVVADERHASRDLVDACDRRGMRLLALADDAPERARAQALGIDAVAWDDGFAAIEAQVQPSARSQGEPERASGRVVAVWGPAGAPGRTTAAIALAAELALLGQRVALVDADTTSASVAPALGLLDESPGFAAAARLARAGSLTVDELDRICQQVPSMGGTVRVLTGIGRSSRWPEIGGDRVAEVLERCRDWVDVTVVDVAASLERDEEISSDLFAPRRHAATLASLEAADEVLVVAGGDAVGIARLVRTLPELRELVPQARVRVVVNKVRASAIGIAPERAVQETLRRLAAVTPEACWPFDGRAADAALLEGRPLVDVAGRSRLRGRVQELATALIPSEAPASRASLRAAERPRRRWLPALR